MICLIVDPGKKLSYVLGNPSRGILKGLVNEDPDGLMELKRKVNEPGVQQFGHGATIGVKVDVIYYIDFDELPEDLEW